MVIMLSPSKLLLKSLKISLFVVTYLCWCVEGKLMTACSNTGEWEGLLRTLIWMNVQKQCMSTALLTVSIFVCRVQAKKYPFDYFDAVKKIEKLILWSHKHSWLIKFNHYVLCNIVADNFNCWIHLCSLHCPLHRTEMKEFNKITGFIKRVFFSLCRKEVLVSWLQWKSLKCNVALRA